MADETLGERKFNWSKMILLNDPRHGGQGGGPKEPPFIVLASEADLRENPQLENFVVERQEPWSVWGGNDPPAVYLSFPDLASLKSNVGDPFIHHLEAPGMSTGSPVLDKPELATFDPNDFEPSDFDTESPPFVEDMTTLTGASEPTVVAGAIASASIGNFTGDAEAVEMAYAIQAKLRSANWTGIEARMAALPGAKEEAFRHIVLLDRAIEKCGLTNVETQKAKALTSALLKLIASPEPDWEIILAILTSRGMNAFLAAANLAGLFFNFGKFLLG